MKINKIAIIVMMALICQIGYGQVTIDDNVPALGNYVGFDNFSTIDLPIENNGVRTLYSFEDWPGYNNRPAISNANRIFMPIEPGITQPNIFSLLQIGWDLDVALQREWMNAGITIGADGNDLMWTGIIPDPDNDDSQAGGDAAIVWGDNISPAAFGPDNLRFIFINDLTTATDGPSSDQGCETMRITSTGNVGMGDSFSNTQQPATRLEVHEEGEDPQFT
jgi:hypothetical protein